MQSDYPNSIPTVSKPPLTAPLLKPIIEIYSESLCALRRELLFSIHDYLKEC